MADVIKFFYKTMLGNKNSSLTATTTYSTKENDIKNIYKMTETNGWKASIENHTSNQYITHDCGSE